MRPLYRLILRAHPKAFRQRFESEMCVVFDDAIGREGGFRLLLDGIASLLRQRIFRTPPKPADAPNVFGLHLVAHQPGLVRMWRVILGSAISFNPFLLVCTLLENGHARPAQRQESSTNDTFAAQSLPASDVTRLSDECAPGFRFTCRVEYPDPTHPPAEAMAGVPAGRAELPRPSGRFGVGQVSYSFSPSEAPAGTVVGASKLFVWYPADIDPNTSLPLDNVWGGSKSDGKFVQTHTVEGAAIAAGTTQFPLILFLPADGNESAAYFSQIENLVSHGYVVASLQDFQDVNAVWFEDTRLTVFETDMRRAFFDPASREPDAVLARARGFEQSREAAASAKLRFAFKQITLIATDRSRDAPFAGRVDLEHVGALGHGSGGNGVAQLCASDARISACVDEDGWTPNGLVAEARPSQLPRQPFLWIEMSMKWPDGAELFYAHITRDQFGRLAKASASDADEELKSAHDAYRVSLQAPGWNDRDFTDGPLVWSMRRGKVDDAEARSALRVINSYSSAFFDEYLKGTPTPLLDAKNKSPSSGIRVQRYGAQ